MTTFDYWNNYYKNRRNNDELNEIRKQSIQDMLDNGYLSYEAYIDNNLESEQVLIYEHKDAEEDKTGEPDKMIIAMNENSYHCGSIIKANNLIYMVIAKPQWNGSYLKGRVEVLSDILIIDEDNNIPCIVSDKLFSDDISSTNEANVFEDMMIKSARIPYNEISKNLLLLDTIVVNDTKYAIANIDNATLKEYDEDYGVLQISLVHTPFFGDIFIDETQVKGLITPERVKDLFTNSTSRAFYCEYTKAHQGDYVDFTYERDNESNTENEVYLIVNRPVKQQGYDKSLLYLCESTMSLLNSKGEVVNIPLYFEDNRTRIDKSTENEFVILSNSSFQFVCQDNGITKCINNTVKRVVINGNLYRVTGASNHKKGLLSFGVELDQKTDDDYIVYNDNGDFLYGIANYYSQMKDLEFEGEPGKTQEIVGYDELYKGYPNEYYLKQSDGSEIVWSCNKPYIIIQNIEYGKVILQFDNLKYTDETIILSAKINGKTITKEIYTTVF